MITPVFKATVEKGQLILHNKPAFQKFVGSRKDGEYKLSLKRSTKARSNQQNRYYWGVIIKMISEETGMFPDETHDALKWKFLRKSAGRFETVHSTTRLSTNEFSEYIDKVIAFASTDLNMRIPLPNEVDLDALNLDYAK